MSLGRHIHSLLKRHSAVFLKGLGTFRRIRTSAYFDAKRKVVLPPITYIEFEHHTEEGFDYTLYVQQSQQLERAAAEAFVKEETDKLAEAIHRDGQADLEELGQLVSYGYSYIFKPIDLSGFQFMPLEDAFIEGENNETSESNVEPKIAAEIRGPEVATEGKIEEVVAEPKEESPETIIAEPAIKSKQQAPSVVSPSVADSSEYEEDTVNKSGNGKTYAVIGVIALLILATLFYLNVFNTGTDSNETVTTTADTSADDSRLQELDSALLALNDSLETPKDSIVAAPTQVVPTVDHRFTIVIGTHPRLELANAEAEEYNKKGHTQVRVLSPNMNKNLKRVIWDTYATKEERDSALRYVQKNIKSDAWPSTVK